MRPYLMLVLALPLLVACQQKPQAHSTGATDATTPTASGAAEARLRAEKQVMINDLNRVMIQLRNEGIEVRKTPSRKPWRLIVPGLASMSPEARRASASELATRFRRELRPVLQRQVEVEIFSDPAERAAVR